MATLKDSEAVLSSVKDYYGKVLSSSKDLKTSACTAASAPHPLIRDIIQKIPAEVIAKFYGCGNPIPLGIRGKRVLDLGSGSGRDCYVAAALVGSEGSVTGIDMTDEQLETARRNIEPFAETLGYRPSLSFVTGHIEFIRDAGIEDGSIDICISNCVLNLSPNKELVLKGVYDALAYGGELYFSDVYVDRRLSDDVRTHPILLGECIGGALYTQDFRRLCQKIGFAEPRELQASVIEVSDPELRKLVGDATFYSITYRLFKLEDTTGLEDREEDYGLTAVYKGTIEGHEDQYQFDNFNAFSRGAPTPVSGNVAAIISQSWLKDHIEIRGDRSKHYGLFNTSKDSLRDRATKQGTGSCCAPKTGTTGSDRGADGGFCSKSSVPKCCPPKSGCC